MTGGAPDAAAPDAGPSTTAPAPADQLNLLISPQGGPLLTAAEPAVPSLALEPATPARNFSRAFSNALPFPNAAGLPGAFLPTSAAVTTEALTQALDKADFSSSKSPGLDALAYVSDALVGGLGTVPGLSLDDSTHADNKIREEAEMDQEGRVMAYAKLEFPEHDFYIRKLEFVIGRRPPNATTAQRAQAELVEQVRDVKKEEDIKPGVDQKPAVESQGDAGLPDSKAEDVNGADHSALDDAKSLLLLHTSPPLLPKRSPPPEIKPAPQTPAKVAPTLPDIDVDLGPIRAVSRDHARIFYDYETSGWMLRVNGRNGVVVEGRWLEKGECVALAERTKIQIAERIFYFVLPTAQSAPLLGNTVDPNAMSINGAGDDALSEDDLDEGPIASGSGSGYGSYSDAEDEEPAEPKGRAGKMPAKAPRSQFRQGGRGVGPAKSNGKAKAAAKAPKGKPATKGKGRNSAAKADDDEDASDSGSPQPPAAPPKRVRPPPVPPKGSEVGTLQRKPPYTYASLVAQALTALNDPLAGGGADEKAKEKGKEKDAELEGATLSEICEWIKGVYPYFSEKGTGTTRGTDWQSSIRHNLNSDKRFIKTENPAAAGSNIKVSAAMALWTLLPSEKPNFTGIEFRKPRPDPPPRPPQMVPQQQQPPRPNLPAPNASTQQKAVGAAPIIVTSKGPPRPTPGPGAQRPGAPPANASRPGPPAGPPRPPAPAPPRPQPQPPPAPPPPAFRIVVGEIPAAARQPVPASALTGDDLASIMQRDPPMVSHEGKLLLNPSIFSHLKPDQVASLEKLGSEQALKILQAYIVQHFKEKMKKAKLAKKQAKKAGQPGADGSPSISASASPAVGQSAPLPAATTGEPTPEGTPGPTKRKAEDDDAAERPAKTVAVEGTGSHPEAVAAPTTT